MRLSQLHVRCLVSSAILALVPLAAASRAYRLPGNVSSGAGEFDRGPPNTVSSLHLWTLRMTFKKAPQQRTATHWNTHCNISDIRSCNTPKAWRRLASRSNMEARSNANSQAQVHRLKMEQTVSFCFRGCARVESSSRPRLPLCIFGGNVFGESQISRLRRLKYDEISTTCWRIN